MRMMKWPCFWLGFFLAVITVAVADTSPRTDTSSGNLAEAPLPKPSFPNTFEVKIEAVFKDKNVEADGSLYFDLKNNIAAMDVLWQSDFSRQIYSFDTNELISIRGYKCDVKDLPDDPKLSFFPFSIDPKTKLKVIASAEEALYFQNSKYIKDSYDEAIESQIYQGFVDVPMYQRNNCSVIHQFSKTNFETATCDSESCKPVILSISVSCPGIPGKSEDIDHLYKFFHFKETIQDDSAFHPPPGVYCNRKGTKSFPSFPMYFSFSYDVAKEVPDDANLGALQNLHKRVWFDADMQLVRVDGFDSDGFLHDIHIYDLYNEMFYMSVPQLVNSHRGTMVPQELSLELITLLPNVLFPLKIHSSTASPLYVGMRKAHGLEYHVWSDRYYDEDNFEVITEMHFITTVSEDEYSGEVKVSGMQLSFLEKYIYCTDGVPKETKLSQVIFVPINNFRNVTREWSAFDVSNWFDNDEKRDFEISVTGPKLTVGNKFYGDFLEQLYLEIVTAATVSLTRISKLEMLPQNDTLKPNSTRFRGVIMENLSNLGYDNQNNESDLNSAFTQLEKFVNSGGLKFTISDDHGEEKTYILDSFKRVEFDHKDEKNCGSLTYSGETVAAVAIPMFLVGLLLGSFGLVALRKKCRGKPQGEIVYVQRADSAIVLATS